MMIGRILTLVYMVISVVALSGQSIEGDWEGELKVPGATLKIVFHIQEDGELYTSTMDSPNQGAYDIAMDETVYDGETLTIKNSQMSMETTATYNSGPDKISGTFKQGSKKMPLELTRVSASDEVAPTNNHPMTGQWNTALDVMGSQMRLVFHITESEGELSTKMDSPDQGAFGIEMEKTTSSDNEIKINDQRMGISISGEFQPDSNLIRARFKQGPLDQEIILTREKIEKKELKRPQEPKEFDYKVEDVNFKNKEGGHQLAGTLTIPASGKFDKAVVLVSGSGPQDRNEELLGHKPFLVLSDHLTKQGIAVLRYDDRGVGESEGDFAAATSMDFSMDAVAAVEYLRGRSEFEGKQIGIMGHSEGGLIAPIAADLTSLDFIVLLAGPGTNSDDLLLEQTEAISLANEVDREDVNQTIESSRIIFDYMNDNIDLPLEELKMGMEKILREQYAKLDEEDKKDLNIEEEMDKEIDQITTPWFRYFLAYEPGKYLSKLQIPVLAVNGSLDLQVLPESNLSGIEEQLKKAGNSNYTIKLFPGLNHLFQTSKNGTGSPNEYGGLEETFNEDAMQFISDWVLNFDKG